MLFKKDFTDEKPKNLCFFSSVHSKKILSIKNKKNSKNLLSSNSFGKGKQVDFFLARQ